jgi:hypothetical protein
MDGYGYPLNNYREGNLIFPPSVCSNRRLHIMRPITPNNINAYLDLLNNYQNIVFKKSVHKERKSEVIEKVTLRYKLTKDEIKSLAEVLATVPQSL